VGRWRVAQAIERDSFSVRWRTIDAWVKAEEAGDGPTRKKKIETALEKALLQKRKKEERTSARR